MKSKSSLEAKYEIMLKAYENFNHWQMRYFSIRQHLLTQSQGHAEKFIQFVKQAKIYFSEIQQLIRTILTEVRHEIAYDDQKQSKAFARTMAIFKNNEANLRQQIESFDQLAALVQMKNKVKEKINLLNQDSLKENEWIEKSIQRNVQNELQIQYSIQYCREAPVRMAKVIQAIKETEITKRLWNNILQEVKGSFRVYCRIRPNESNAPSDMIVLNGNCSLTLRVPEKFQKSANYSKESFFNLEHIFTEDASQTEIFNQLAQLVQNVVDGYNVCIFAYGQTGSGKTFTMQGGKNDERGVIPRAIEQIFTEVRGMARYGSNVIVKVGFQEIYNDTVKDLITGAKADEPMFKEVKCEQEVNDLFNSAMDNRKVAETNCNEFSSRSHFIFLLNLTASLNDKVVNSTLSLVDLAGSERATATQGQQERQVETKFINKSLSSLGDVFNALFNKIAHVPFRNSKLTFVLQRYLEGSSKTLMMVNVSSKIEDFNQTLASLRFAEKVKTCKTGPHQEYKR